MGFFGIWVKFGNTKTFTKLVELKFSRSSLKHNLFIPDQHLRLSCKSKACIGIKYNIKLLSNIGHLKRFSNPLLTLLPRLNESTFQVHNCFNIYKNQNDSGSFLCILSQAGCNLGVHSDAIYSDIWSIKLPVILEERELLKRFELFSGR